MLSNCENGEMYSLGKRRMGRASKLKARRKKAKQEAHDNTEFIRLTQSIYQEANALNPQSYTLSKGAYSIYQEHLDPLLPRIALTLHIINSLVEGKIPSQEIPDTTMEKALLIAPEYAKNCRRMQLLFGKDLSFWSLANLAVDLENPQINSPSLFSSQMTQTVEPQTPEDYWEILQMVPRDILLNALNFSQQNCHRPLPDNLLNHPWASVRSKIELIWNPTTRERLNNYLDSFANMAPPDQHWAESYRFQVASKLATAIKMFLDDEL